MINIISAGLEAFSKALDRVIPDENLKKQLIIREKELDIDLKKLDFEYELELEKLQNQIQLQPIKLAGQINSSQAKINNYEAKNKNLFVSGWRPAIGWICAASFGYSSIIYPLLSIFIDNLPLSHVDVLFNVMLGMLGLGGLRTYEKLKGINNIH